MAITAARLLTSGQVISTTVGSVGDISLGDRFQISDLVLVNSGSDVRIVNLYVIQSGTVVTDKDKILVDKRIGAGETYISLEMIGLVIKKGGSIQAVVDSGTDISISIVGKEFST